MKNLIIALALAFPAAALADTASVAPVLPTQSGTYVSNVAAQNLTYIGAQTYRIEVSTPADQAILLLSGKGLLYSLVCSSGVANGTYALAFDSASASGITVATAGKAISPQVYTAGQIVDTTITPNAGYNPADRPQPFANGLVGIVHKGVANCLFQARLAAGNNPGQ